MIWSAFFVGLLGSLHCVGMCGPIALALPIAQERNRYAGILLYNLGRIITYSIFGLLFGAFGSLFLLAGLQQLLSVASGAFLLGAVVFSLWGNTTFVKINFISRVLSSVKTKLAFYLKKHSYSSLFLIGFLNGLLPCGLVYVAVVGAIAMGDVLKGSYYMMLFGLGTIPAMVLVAVSKNSIRKEWRYKLTKSIPVFVAMMGIVLILRGLNLGIPYLSPEISSEKPLISGCCKK